MRLDRLGNGLAAIRFPAPAGLDQRILARLDDETTASSVPERPRLPAGPGRWVAAIAACTILGALISWRLAMTVHERGLVVRDAVTAHIRALMTTGIEIASADPHVVKPWFAGRVDFAPRFRDLVSDGFPLSGGRLDFVGERRVAVVVYKRRQHVINVFMWAATTEDGPTGPAQSSQRGYNVVSWSRAGVSYIAVSDLNVGELMQLQAML